MFNFLKKNKLNIESEVIADLDAMLSSNVAFKFKGKVHVLKPIDLETFMLATEAMARADALLKKKEISYNECVQQYVDIICSVCDTISKEDIEQMTIAQVSALLNLVLETISGKVLEKKKDNRETEEQQKRKIKLSLLVAEVCRFYGWTVEYCLKMPARRFFAMYDAAIQLQALERIHLCDIQSISIMNAKGFEAVKNYYERIFYQYANVNREVKKTESFINNDDAKTILFELFASKKRLQ